MKIRILTFCFAVAILMSTFVSCADPPDKETESDPELILQEASATQSFLRSVVAVKAFFHKPGESSDALAYATAYGSAVVFSVSDGTGAYLITNYHVLYDNMGNRVASRVLVAPYGIDTPDGVDAELVGYIEPYDIALLYSEKLTDIFPAAKPIEAGDAAKIGEPVLAVGNALGRSLSVTCGTVSVPRETLEIHAGYLNTVISLPVIRVDCALNDGNSGGGLFSSSGNFLGLVCAREVTDNKKGLGYALPASVVLTLAQKLMRSIDTKDPPTFFHFGAEISERNSVVQWNEETQSLVTQCEVTVGEVSPGSIASAFFEPGDILLSVCVNEGQAISLVSEVTLSDILLGVEVGDTLSFVYRRQDSPDKAATFTVSSYHMEY